MKGYTKVDNWLFDVVMPSVSPIAYTVISTVYRQTAGWNKEMDVISLSQFQKMTGVAGRHNMVRAITEALESGFIGRRPAGQSFEYYIITSNESLLVDEANQSQSVTSTSHESLPLTSHESLHTKEHTKIQTKEKEEDDPIVDLAEHFTRESGIIPTASNYAEGWIKPLELMLERAKTPDKAKRTITAAVEFARNGSDKKYTIVSPKSIVNIAANLQTEDVRAGIGAR